MYTCLTFVHMGLCLQDFKRFDTVIRPAIWRDVCDYKSTCELLHNLFRACDQWSFRPYVEQLISPVKKENFLTLTVLLGTSPIYKFMRNIEIEQCRRMLSIFFGWQRLIVRNWNKVWHKDLRTMIIDAFKEFITSLQGFQKFVEKRIIYDDFKDKIFGDDCTKYWVCDWAVKEYFGANYMDTPFTQSMLRSDANKRLVRWVYVFFFTYF